MELKDLKEAYKKAGEKYNLPGFHELNERFDIDRIEREVDFILREVRKLMMDKIIGYIRFIEMILNPSQAPPMFMFFVKNIFEEDKKILERAYERFIELELRSLKLEIDYNEKEEAEAIKNIFNVWEDARPDLRQIVSIMEKNWKTAFVKKERGYFG